jgi:capsular exopolysaccharide synthesis family protein
MSQIFDALQRSEAENAGTDLSALKQPTEVLELAERRATAQWEEAGMLREGGHSIVSELPQEFAAKLRSGPVSEPPREFASQQRAAQTLETQAEVETGSQPAGAAPEAPGQFQSIAMPDSSAASRFVCYTQKQSGAAEAFRMLGVRLRHLRRDRALKRVLITSTIPQEGKSTIAANLACTLASTTRQRTLLLEGDVRRPSLSKTFGLVRKTGLCDWLRGESSLTSCIYHLDGPNFSFLPAGTAPSDPLELLQSGRLSLLLDQLSSWFDWIVIDSPPVLPLADTSVWSRLADGILLVARQGITEKRKLRRGLEAIERRKLIGALLNSSSTASGDGYYYATPDSAASK